MPNEINIAEFIKEVLPARLMTAQQRPNVIIELNKLPLTGVQRVDIMIQWLDAFNLKLTGEEAKELGA